MGLRPAVRSIGTHRTLPGAIVRERVGLLTPLDGELWALRLVGSELTALQADWARVAGPAPGHDFRRELARAREVVERARRDVDARRAPPADWVDRARGHLRAARRLLVRRELAYYAPWWPADRRYLG
ncbi:MAG TPA: hypothetical protein VFC93_05580 [Chloroflexota bacterium]|nr:hypothetical protein [Chloroflexota bacterium]